MTLANLEVVTLFVDDFSATRQFYERVFDAEIVYSDDVSAVFAFGGAMINLLDVNQAPELISPAAIGGQGARTLLTIKVEDVDTECERLASLGVSVLNGPVDRPWGRRTAAFADPSGHIWELAQVI